MISRFLPVFKIVCKGLKVKSKVRIYTDIITNELLSRADDLSRTCQPFSNSVLCVCISHYLQSTLEMSHYITVKVEDTQYSQHVRHVWMKHTLIICCYKHLLSLVIDLQTCILSLFRMLHSLIASTFPF